MIFEGTIPLSVLVNNYFGNIIFLFNIAMRFPKLLNSEWETWKEIKGKSWNKAINSLFTHALYFFYFNLFSFWICMCVCTLCMHTLRHMWWYFSPVTFTWHTPCFIKCTVGSYWISQAHLEVLCRVYMWLWNHSAFQVTITHTWLNPNNSSYLK